MALEKIGVEAVIEGLSSFRRGIDQMDKGVDSFGSTSQKTTPKVENLFKSFLTSAVAISAIKAVGDAVKQFAQESIAEFQAFEHGSAEVFTLLPGLTQQAMDSMRSDVLEFSAAVGRQTNETIPALYQAISAGVPQENVFDFLQVASDAALGGVTDLETAVDGITSVVNAYGSDVIDAAEASDLLFTAVKGGKTNFEELSRFLFQVIPTAASLGVEFGNVTAAMATLTAQGTPTRVAATQLRQLLVELSKDGSEAARVFEEIAGKSFPDFVAEGGNLQQALQFMEQAAQDSNVRLSDMFGSIEAGNAALGLTGASTDKFTQELAAAADAAGATAEAAATMAESMEHLENRTNATTEALKIQVGEALSPLKRAYLETKIAATDFLSESVRLRNEVLNSSDALEQFGYEGVALQKALGAIGQGTIFWRESLVSAEEMAYRTDIAVRILNRGFRGGADELGKLVQAEVEAEQAALELGKATEITDKAVLNSVASYQMAQEQAKELARIQREEAMQAALELGHATESADQVLFNSVQTYQLAQEQIAELAIAEEEAAAAAAVHEEALRNYFVSALNAKDGTGFFNESLDELGQQFVTIGGRTAQQSADLSDLQAAYDKAAQTVRDYELGIKGANLTDEDRNEKIAEQQALMDGLAEKMQPLISITGELTSKNVEATINQDAVNQAIFDAAVAADGNAVSLALLGGELGIYSEQATIAALKSALIQEEINQLAAAYVNGDTSVAQMRQELSEFIGDLDGVAEEMIGAAHDADSLTSSAGSLGAEIGNVSAAAIEATNNLNNIPNDIPVTIRIHTEGSVPTLPTGPGGQQQPQAFQSGGFTGRGPRDEFSGLVHYNEIVLPQDVLMGGASDILGFVNANMPNGIANFGGSVAAQPSVVNQSSMQNDMSRSVQVNFENVSVSNDMDLQMLGDFIVQKVSEAI